jgi:hypothetical protein
MTTDDWPELPAALKQAAFEQAMAAHPLPAGFRARLTAQLRNRGPAAALRWLGKQVQADPALVETMHRQLGYARINEALEHLILDGQLAYDGDTDTFRRPTE